MWWAPIVSAVAALAGAIIGGAIALHVNARNRRHQIEERARERQNQLADSHRNALRQAYGEVFNAWTKFTVLASRYVPDCRRVHRLYKERERLGQDVDHHAYQEADRKWREANDQALLVSDELQTIASDTHGKVTMALMLEDDLSLREMLEALIPLMGIGADEDENLELLEHAVNTRRAQLERLSQALRGHFAPTASRVTALQRSVDPKQLER